jgi:hypothetical protein
MTDPLAAFVVPPKVKAVDGEVVVIGDGVCAAYTPEAARATAEQLLLAAEFASEQRSEVRVFFNRGLTLWHPT